MALKKGTKRFKHIVTEEVKYFKNTPDPEFWIKVGTPGSVDWRWIHNATEERFVRKDDPLTEGFTLGRIKI